MVDDELMRQQHDLSGETVVACDLCRRPVVHRETITLAGRRGRSEPIEEIRVCPACRDAVAHGELPFAAAVAAGAQITQE